MSLSKKLKRLRGRRCEEFTSLTVYDSCPECNYENLTETESYVTCPECGACYTQVMK